jgi:hypothetical protein
MARNVGNSIKGNWKPILWGLGPIAILAIVFALPIKTVPVQTTETYWDTEIRNEPYTTTESYTEEEPYTATETRTETVYDSYVYSGNWSHTFEVDRANSTISVKFSGYSHYPYYPYYYIACPGDDLSSSCIWPYYDYYLGGRGKAIIEVSYPEEVTKYRTVTKYRDVTQYREVPTQVQKERTVTQDVKMSIWAYLFR